MAEHLWIKVGVEADGVCLFWECPVCGVGGGPASDRDVSKGTGGWEPFILGAGRRVSEDCDEAQKQIREYAEEVIARIREKYPEGAPRHYASLFHDALRWNPQITDLHPVLDLMQSVEYPEKRPSLIDCRMKLGELGFDMSGGLLGTLVKAVGERMPPHGTLGKWGPIASQYVRMDGKYIVLSIDTDEVRIGPVEDTVERKALSADVHWIVCRLLEMGAGAISTNHEG